MHYISRYMVLAAAFILTFSLIACGGMEDEVLCADMKAKIQSCVPDAVMDDGAQCSAEFLSHYDGFMDLECDQLGSIGKADWWWILAAAAGAVLIGSMIANSNKNKGNNNQPQNPPYQPPPPPPCNGPQCNQQPSQPLPGHCYASTQCGNGQCVALEGMCSNSGTVPYNGVCSNFEGWQQPHLCQQGLFCKMTNQLHVTPNGHTVNIYRCLAN